MVDRNDFFRILLAILSGIMAYPAHGSTEPMINAQITTLVNVRVDSMFRLNKTFARSGLGIVFRILLSRWQ